MRPLRILPWLCTFLSCTLALGVTYSLDEAHRRLDAADLVAEVLITGRRALPHPQHFTVTQADAVIERVLNARSSATSELSENDHIVIEAPGGERGNIGVTLSGYPRPYNGHRYTAYLNRTASGTYTIAGFNQGLQPLDSMRNFSQNRTDGVNGDGTGAFLHWDNDYFPIPYFVDAESFRDHLDFLPAIDASFRPWKAPENVRLDFVAMGCTAKARVENDGINNVILVTSGWKFDNDAIAITRSFYVAGSEPRAGLILDADISLNGQGHAFTTTNQAGHHDIQNIVTHEVGHLLGLGHEVDTKDTQATMYANANANETNKRTLSDNDLKGLRAVYLGVGTKVADSATLSLCQLPSNNRGCAFVAPSLQLPLTTGTVFAQIAQWCLLFLGIPLGRAITKRFKA